MLFYFIIFPPSLRFTPFQTLLIDFKQALTLLVIAHSLVGCFDNDYMRHFLEQQKPRAATQNIKREKWSQNKKRKNIDGGMSKDTWHVHSNRVLAIIFKGFKRCTIKKKEENRSRIIKWEFSDMFHIIINLKIVYP